MSVAGLVGIPLELFSGRVTDIPATDLPPGASPANQDCAYELGAVKTRPGIGTGAANFAPLAGNPTVNYLKTFTDGADNNRMLFLDGTGRLWQQFPENGRTQLNATAGGFTVTPGALAKSVTYFGREYIAFSDGKDGVDAPLQVATNIGLTVDRVSQAGPGTPPTAVDSATAGVISAGIHLVSQAFITRQGYITKFSPTGSWVAAGGKSVDLSNIAIAPEDPNIVGRIVAITAAAGADLRYLQNFVIMDNTTTVLTVNFSDAQLLAGSPTQARRNLVELGECAGVIGYSQRLFWWGERNKISNFLNLSFDGGRVGAIPTGWTVDVTNGVGGALVAAPSMWDGAWSITGDGNVAHLGMLTQSAYQDYLGVPLLQPQIAWSARVRLAVGLGATTGNVTIELFSPSQGSKGTFVVPIANLTINYQEFTGALAASMAAIPADLLLRVYANPANLTPVYIDSIEIFPTQTPNLGSQVRGSYQSDPESYDGITSLMQVANNNGQDVRSAFVLREKLYFVKEHSMYETADDGQNEPSSWPITEISPKVGTPAVNGTAAGEEWAVIASREGAYIFWGDEPVKFSQEIQPDWNTIAWQWAHRMWVRIDTANRRILIGAPTGTAQWPNKIFMFDYRGLDNAQQIADHWSVRYSSYTGKIIAIGNAPKWSIWNISANSCGLIERADGTAHVFLGNGVGNGKVYDLLDSNKNDDGAGIPWSYSTYYVPGHMDEQALQLGSERKLFGFLAGLVEGSGTMAITANPAGNGAPIPLPSINLVDASAAIAITAISRQNGVTAVTAPNHGLTAGVDNMAVIAGAGDPTLNGQLPILKVLSANQLLIAQPNSPDSFPAAGGTVTRLLREFEFGVNFSATRASFTFSNQGNAQNCWFRMQQFCPYLSRDPFTPLRGSN
jgi:hypothetical protein